MAGKFRARVIKRGEFARDLVMDVTDIIRCGYRMPSDATLVAVGRIVALCSYTEADGLQEVLEWFLAAQRSSGKKRLNKYVLRGLPLKPPARRGWTKKALTPRHEQARIA